ncbi:MAG: hypothetical protein AAF736_18045 [Pseudomonadota bacterium]
MSLTNQYLPRSAGWPAALYSMLLTLPLLVGGLAQAQDVETINIPLSRPGEPVSIDVSILSAHIEVIGEDREDVQFDVSVLSGQRSIITPSGAKPIKTGGYSLEVEEEDNRISLNSDWRTNRVRVTIHTPHDANLELSTVNDGVIEISDVNGEFELSNVNGPITATNVSGSVIAESVNEDIRIELTGLESDHALSLTSVNGNLTVALPNETGAEFHIDTARGNIYSDFEVEVRPTKPMVDRSRKGRGVKVKVGTVITALVNGGGPVIKTKTLNGDIQIAKSAG